MRAPMGANFFLVALPLLFILRHSVMDSRRQAKESQKPRGATHRTSGNQASQGKDFLARNRMCLIFRFQEVHHG